MKREESIMGMPVIVSIAGVSGAEKIFDDVFFYFRAVDERFSTYKENSEMSKINRGEIKEEEWSDEMRTVFVLSEETKKATGGYFDIKKPDGKYDPSGLVKGWAIWNAAQIIEKKGYKNFYVEAGGDIQTSGMNENGERWNIGIKNPFDKSGTVRTVSLSGEGIATSGTYEKGDHIYDPKSGMPASGIVSLTVIGPNVYEADRFATAAFAMGADGIKLIENTPGLEGYMIDDKGVATMTSGFGKYAVKN